jgi:hypothetical protein
MDVLLSKSAKPVMEIIISKKEQTIVLNYPQCLIIILIQFPEQLENVIVFVMDAQEFLQIVLNVFQIFIK